VTLLKSAVRAVRRTLVATGLDRPLAALDWPLPKSLRPYADEYPKPSLRRAKRRGIEFALDPSDFVQWLTYMGAENDQRECLLALAKPGATVIDVGANIGDTLLSLGQRVGSNGRVIGFEANPETLKKCQTNIALNSMGQVRVEGIGLGAQAGALGFGRAAAGNSGADRFMPEGGGTITVPIIPLDSYVTEQGLDRCDLIKIDVEGFEMNVLRGASATLAKFRPVLFLELSDDNLREQGSSAVELLQWLEARGYAVRDALSGADLRSDDPHIAAFTDIICRSIADA
jgi:FkbM family methyltransferase